MHDQFFSKLGGGLLLNYKTRGGRKNAKKNTGFCEGRRRHVMRARAGRGRRPEDERKAAARRCAPGRRAGRPPSPIMEVGGGTSPIRGGLRGPSIDGARRWHSRREQHVVAAVNWGEAGAARSPGPSGSTVGRGTKKRPTPFRRAPRSAPRSSFFTRGGGPWNKHVGSEWGPRQAGPLGGGLMRLRFPRTCFWR